VIKENHSPVIGDMTGIAALTGSDMTTMFAFRGCPVVATFAGADDGLMIHAVYPAPTER